MRRSIRTLVACAAMTGLLSSAQAASSVEKPEVSARAAAPAHAARSTPHRAPAAVTMSGLVCLMLVGQVLLRRR